jgi:hypothetical protein
LHKITKPRHKLSSSQTKLLGFSFIEFILKRLNDNPNSKMEAPCVMFVLQSRIGHKEREASKSEKRKIAISRFMIFNFIKFEKISNNPSKQIKVETSMYGVLEPVPNTDPMK